jgi:competence protein ComEA
MPSKIKSSLLSRWVVILLFAAGAVLLIAAFWVKDVEAPEQWLLLNDKLGEALSAEDTGKPESAPVAPGSQQQGMSSIAVPDKAAEAVTDRNVAVEEASAAAGDGVRGLDEEGKDSHTDGASSTEAAEEPLMDEQGRLNLNQAQAEDLIALPGIGPSKAQAIVDDRSRNGRFRSVEEITRVKGIGTKMLEKIKNSIVVYPGL